MGLNKKGSVLENGGEHWSIVITKKQMQRSKLYNVRWRHHIRWMLRMMPPLLSLSLLVSSSSQAATALTETMSESVPFFFCSDFCKEFFVDLN